jgi:hypothetical protein
MDIENFLFVKQMWEFYPTGSWASLPVPSKHGLTANNII